MAKQQLVITANFTAEPVGDSLGFWIDTLRLPFEVTFSPFDQVFQQLLDPTSQLSRNTSGMNIVLVKLDNWARAADAGSPQLSSSVLQRNVAEFVGAIKAAAARTSPLLVVSCPAAPDLTQHAPSAEVLSDAEAVLADGLAGAPNIKVVSSAALLDAYAVDTYYDREAETLGSIPYTAAFFAGLGTLLARRIRASRTAPYKVLVLDCDNTLWKGVCGEVGAAGVEIDDDMRVFQRFVLDQHEAGMLLCLCSKNNEADAREVFSTRPEMLLNWDHFIASRINWMPKSENLKSLAAELSLGTDSFVFVDDSPFEIGEVRANCPEVMSLQFPTDTTGIHKFVKHSWVFDRLTVTAEDRRRAAAYKENLLREGALKQAGNLDDYLRDLDLRVDIAVPAADDFARMAQMTQRTNQFNVSTIRREESELRRLCGDREEGLEGRVVHVRDRFGEYGLVGVMLFREREQALRVDTMLLSCRVLGRRVEHRMLSELGAIAQARGLDDVEIPFVRSKKNTPALEFLVGLHPEAGPGDADRVFVWPAETASRVVDSVVKDAPVPAIVREETSRTPSIQQAGESADVITRIFRELDSPARVLEAVQSMASPVRLDVGRPMIAPRNDAERVIADSWKQGLHLDAVSVTDNYFDLGGTSLIAVPIFAKLRREFGDSLNPSLLFRAPTVEQLAALITQEDAVRGVATSRWTSLVPIQPDGSQPPLFCVHGGAGSILFYYPLARALGSDQPVYALQPRGLYGADMPHASVPEMAAHYIAEIRTVQPSGPYRLAGFCFGATIAFEMAQQLHGIGEQAGCIISFDGVAPRFGRKGKNSQSADGDHETTAASPLSEKSRPSLSGATARGVRQLGRALRDRWELVVRKGMSMRIRILRAYTARSGGPLPPVLRRFPWYFPINSLLAKQRYRPTTYSGTMTVFTIKDRYSEPTLGWDRWVTGGVTAHEIPGELRRHRDLMKEPMIAIVADAIRRLLSADEAESAQLFPGDGSAGRLLQTAGPGAPLSSV